MVKLFAAIFAVAALQLGAESSALAEPVASTPAGYALSKQKGCLVVQARVGISSQRWDDGWCDLVPDPSVDGGGIAEHYALVPDLLVRALDFAEQLACGRLGCAVRDRAARVIILRDDFPNAWVTANDSSLTIVVTTGMVNIVEYSTNMYLDEMRAQARGDGTQKAFTDWIRTVDSHAGHSCVLPSLPAPRQLTSAEVRDLRGAAQITYTFIIGHELAHLRSSNNNCGTDGSSDIGREIGCDQMSFDALLRGKAVLPPILFAPLLAMSHYESVYGNQFGAHVRAIAKFGQALRSAMPARRFEVRAKALRTLWTQFCSRSSPGNPACPSSKSMQNALVGEADRLIGFELPRVCIVGGADPAVLSGGPPESE